VVQLNQGDLVIFPREIPHSKFPIRAMQGEQRHLAFVEAEDLEGAGMLCGKLTFEHVGSGVLINYAIRHYVEKACKDRLNLQRRIPMPWQSLLLAYLRTPSFERTPL
jgi:hypothetical protein